MILGGMVASLLGARQAEAGLSVQHMEANMLQLASRIFKLSTMLI
jgi:hypothetical protein